MHPSSIKEKNNFRTWASSCGPAKPAHLFIYPNQFKKNYLLKQLWKPIAARASNSSNFAEDAQEWAGPFAFFLCSVSIFSCSFLLFFPASFFLLILDYFPFSRKLKSWKIHSNFQFPFHILETKIEFKNFVSYLVKCSELCFHSKICSKLRNNSHCFKTRLCITKNRDFQNKLHFKNIYVLVKCSQIKKNVCGYKTHFPNLF